MPPSYVVSDNEALWELSEHRSIAIEHRPERAGYGSCAIFIEEFDNFISSANERGITPTKTETYSNGVRKAIYLDPDGNELGFDGGKM
ncbi:MAG: VOC family protein [Micrococcaceae bacterium]